LDKCLHTMPTIAAEARCRIHDNDWFPVLSLGLHGPSVIRSTPPESVRSGTKESIQNNL
jgi:hypothetical protein